MYVWCVINCCCSGCIVFLATLTSFLYRVLKTVGYLCAEMLGLKHTLPSGQTFGLLLPHHRGFLLSTEHLASFYCCLSVLMKGSTAAEWYGFRFAMHSVQLPVNLLLHSNLKTFIYTDAFSFVEIRLEGDVQKPLSLLIFYISYLLSTRPMTSWRQIHWSISTASTSAVGSVSAVIEEDWRYYTALLLI